MTCEFRLFCPHEDLTRLTTCVEQDDDSNMQHRPSSVTVMFVRPYLESSCPSHTPMCSVDTRQVTGLEPQQGRCHPLQEYDLDELDENLIFFLYLYRSPDGAVLIPTSSLGGQLRCDDLGALRSAKSSPSIAQHLQPSASSSTFKF